MWRRAEPGHERPLLADEFIILSCGARVSARDFARRGGAPEHYVFSVLPRIRCSCTTQYRGMIMSSRGRRDQKALRGAASRNSAASLRGMDTTLPPRSASQPFGVMKSPTLRDRSISALSYSQPAV